MIQDNNADGVQSRTMVERRGNSELSATRIFDAPSSAVFSAWTNPELFQRWWVPKSAPGILLVSCEMDVRTGGRYRLVFGADDLVSMAFYGIYLEVVANERIVWTNDEGVDGAITTVTFENQGRTTIMTFHEIYPSKEALEEALQGSAAALPEQLDQLDALLSGAGG